MSGLASYGRGPFRFTGDAGIAILEAPLENSEQNDVLAYSLHGRASTRRQVPVGTEDLGRLQLGADYAAGRWLLDAGVAVGFAGISPDWEVSGWLSLVLGPRGVRTAL